ncbi:MAG: outer membrane protein assembly factor BamE [Alphaproteobacteria bacterium]|nr:outer membrane protein assembly factor BamE [Alphaproteobacteria bacterium]
MRKAVPVLLVASALALSACTRIPNNIGYVADESLVQSVAPGVDNRQSVQATLGRPSIAGAWDDRTWYYLSRETRQFAFRVPTVAQQQIIAITFDDKGTVAKVERRGKEQIANITPESDKTPTLGRESGFFQDLFGNIGRAGVGGAAGGPGGGPNGT